MNKKQLSKIVDKRSKELIKFLLLTKEGKYAPIDESSLPYSRVQEETETIDACQDLYYYNIA